jgi:hypothetical protein
MNPEIKAQWVAALRSGEYKQGMGMLKTLDGEYCCLGVLCDLAHKAGATNLVTSVSEIHGTIEGYGYGPSDNIMSDDVMTGELPEDVQAWAGLEECNPAVKDSVGHGVSLISLNDSEGHTFEQIADAIERDL